MNILNECTFIKPNGIEIIEKKYNAKYVLESSIQGIDGQWFNFPVAIFYTETPHPHGSNYFAMYLHPTKREHLMICDGITAVKETYLGLKVDDNVIYSRYRHDFRELNDMFVDGGRDYFRSSGPQENVVKFKIVKDKLEIINDN
jgi:hypothetical protein